MTKIALTFILLHYILSPVLFASSIKFPGFNMRKESLLLFTFEITNELIFTMQGGCSPVGFGVGFWFFGWLFLIQCMDYFDLCFWKGTLIDFSKVEYPKLHLDFQGFCVCAEQPSVQEGFSKLSKYSVSIL